MEVKTFSFSLLHFLSETSVIYDNGRTGCEHNIVDGASSSGRLTSSDIHSFLALFWFIRPLEEDDDDADDDDVHRGWFETINPPPANHCCK